MALIWFPLLTAAALLCRPASAHGRLREPPSRASMWRDGFKSPVNYADNQLFCGGFAHQWQQQDGRCGVCGDPYDGPRDHEPGGKFYSGIITRIYTRGQPIAVRVQLTAFHYGWFEFRLCPLEYRNQTVGQECFDRFPLEVVNDSSSESHTRWRLPDDPSIIEVNLTVLLPPTVTCEQCVFQWKYHAANSWGQEPSGSGCIGCGAQEEFFGCSDIAIQPEGGATGNSLTNQSSEGYEQASISTEDTSHEGDSPKGKAAKTSPLEALLEELLESDGDNSVTESHQDDWPKMAYPGEDGFSPFTEPEPKSLSSLKDMKATLVGQCHATGAWKGQASMDDWCEINCERGHCPKSHCACARSASSARALQSGRRSPSQSAFPSSIIKEPLDLPRDQPSAYNQVVSSEYDRPSSSGWSPFSGIHYKRRRQRPLHGDSNKYWKGPSVRKRLPGRFSYDSPPYTYLGKKLSKKRDFVKRSYTRPTPGRRSMLFWPQRPKGHERMMLPGDHFSFRKGNVDNPYSDNSLESGADISDLLAYSQNTFQKLKSQAEAAYRSVVGKSGKPMDIPSGIYDSYDAYDYDSWPSYMPNDLYQASGIGLLGHSPRKASSRRYWHKPQGKSLDVYTKKTYPTEPVGLGKPGSHFDGSPLHGSSSSSYANNDAELIAKARFIDEISKSRGQGIRSPEAKSASIRGSLRGKINENCVATGAWTGQAPMTKWCQGNCPLGNCPATHCLCT